MAVAVSAAVLAACEPIPQQTRPPQSRPAPPATAEPARPSEESAALAAYYRRVQSDLLAQGLLRTDGGGPDTPYTDTDLARNFEQIAFFDEYIRGAGLKKSSGGPGQLKRWGAPVRMRVIFGDSVQPAQRTRDLNNITQFALRLGRVTGHPIGMSRSSANFHVMIMGQDDRDQMIGTVRSIAPQINAAALDIFRELPRSIHCLVIAFSTSAFDATYTKAIALVRAEHPDLLRLSCVHEELAQGLGLANDSPAARPSIFNDDDEFALLTSHDEKLLRMLYDPRLRTGMSAAEARPILRQIAAGLMPGSS